MVTELPRHPKERARFERIAQDGGGGKRPSEPRSRFGFRVSGFGFRVSGFGFRVSGSAME